MKKTHPLNEKLDYNLIIREAQKSGSSVAILADDSYQWIPIIDILSKRGIRSSMITPYIDQATIIKQLNKVNAHHIIIMRNLIHKIAPLCGQELIDIINDPSGLPDDYIMLAKTSNHTFRQIPEQKNHVHITSRPPTSIFLTGSTGVLGAHILKNLLEESDCDVYCLTRGTTPKDGYARISRLLMLYGVTPEKLGSYTDRLKVLPGSLEQKYFGWGEKEFLLLASKIDLTIHSAGLVSLMCDYNDLYQTNVLGIEHMIDFVLHTVDKRILHVSTHSVLGDRYRQNCRPYYENDYDLGQSFEALEYQFSKFEGEGKIRQAQAAGLKWIIVRPGNILGESGHGIYPFYQTNMAGVYYDIFKTVIETKLAFISPMYFDVTPLNYVSQAICYFAFSRNTPYATYHLVNPDVKRYSEVIDLIRQCDHPITIISLPEYFQRLRQGLIMSNGKKYSSKVLLLARLKPMLINSSESSYADSHYTTALLSNAGIECPLIDLHLIKKYVSQCLKDNYIKL